MSTTQSSAQLVPLCAGTQPTSTQYVDWLQVQGFLDMAESALKAKTAANEVRYRCDCAPRLSWYVVVLKV